MNAEHGLKPVRPNEDIRIRRAVTPIFVRDIVPGRQPSAGTGVFVQLGGLYFLFTAGHVVEPIKQNNNTFSIALEGEKEPLCFRTECLFSFIKDGVDYGIIGLHGEIHKLLKERKNIEWVSIDELFIVNDKLQKDSQFNAMGYPGAGSSWDDKKDEHLEVVMTKMSGPLGPSNFKTLKTGSYDFIRPDIAGIETLEFLFPKNQIRIELSNSKHSSNPQDLQGMSGGGFWLTPKEGDLPSEAKLFAILSNHFDNDHIPKKDGEDCIHVRIVKVSSHLHLVYKNYKMLQGLIKEKFPILDKIWEEYIK